MYRTTPRASNAADARHSFVVAVAAAFVTHFNSARFKQLTCCVKAGKEFETRAPLSFTAGDASAIGEGTNGRSAFMLIR